MSDATRKPVAWAIVGEDGIVLDSHIYHTRSVAKRNAAEMQETLVPLYRDPPPPALTDAEREAVQWAIEVADSLAECSGAGTGGEPSREANTLRGLLARLGGET